MNSISLWRKSTVLILTDCRVCSMKIRLLKRAIKKVYDIPNNKDTNSSLADTHSKVRKYTANYIKKNSSTRHQHISYPYKCKK